MLGRRGIVIFPEELDERWEERIYKAGINVLGLSPDPGIVKTPEEIYNTAFSPEKAAVIKRLRDNGVTVEWEIHSLSWLLPREHFEKHPEWFRMDSEHKRVKEKCMCSSSSEALETVSENAAKLAEIFKSPSHRYNFWLDDVTDSGCHCESCSKLSHADQALKIYNAVIRGLRRTDPLAVQCFLAYHDNNSVPLTVKPEEEIFLEYAPMVRDFDKCIADESSEKNRIQNKNLRGLLEFFGKKNSQVLDYWLDNSLFSDWKKPPKPFKLRRETFVKDLSFDTSQFSVIGGNLYDSAGKPIKNATITMQPSGVTAVTDDNGYYKFEYIVPGSHTLEYNGAKSSVNIAAGISQYYKTVFSGGKLNLTTVDTSKYFDLYSQFLTLNNFRINKLLGFKGILLHP